MKTSIQLVILLLLTIIPISLQAATGPYNAGFVSGLWYSKVPFFAGETIRIYTAFQNHSGGDITGAVQFFDNDTSIGQANFSALNDRLVETWIDWTVTYGNHAISAKIIETKRSEAGKPPEKIEVLASQSKPETVFADNIPLPPQPKADQSPTETVIQTVSNISSKVVEGVVNAIDNFVPYSPPPAPVVSVAPATPVIPVTLIVEKKVENTTTTVLVTSAVQKENTTAPATSSGGGDTNNPVSSITKSILNTVDDYTQNLLQTVDAQRRKIKSDIKNIDEVYKRIDTDRDGLIGLTDFNVLMINWGKKGVNIADYNQDGVVDIIDFNILMIYWS